MSEIISHMSSIPEDRWEKAFGKKETNKEQKDIYTSTNDFPEIVSPIYYFGEPDTQEC